MKKKIAFVIHRYGEGVDGGAAAHCRSVAEQLLRYYDVEVLTSTSLNYPYNEYFETGTDLLNGVIIRRFAIERFSDETLRTEYKKKMMQGSQEFERKWMEENGPFCPALIDYLETNFKNYKAIFFFGYNHYLSYAGIMLNLPNSILIPLAHDEAPIYTSAAESVFKNARAFMFNTIEEKQLVERLFGKITVPNRVTCYGLDIEAVGDSLPDKYQSLTPFIIFAGRVTQNKNFAELNKYFIEYKKKRNTNLKLLVLGRVQNGFSFEYHEDIVFTGYVSESEKRALMRNAVLLVLPSKYESLSIVVLESFMQERPVLVNGRCPVLVGQCRRSNAGLYYTNYSEFEAELDYLIDNRDICDQLGKNGREFVIKNYSWDSVLDNFNSIIKEIGYEP